MRRSPENEREVLFGVHPVLEALESGRRVVDRILVARESTSGLGRLLRIARETGVPVTHLPRNLLAQKAGARAVHQGIVALVSAVPYADPDEICRTAVASAGIVVVLEGVTDPRNLGAILRTAAAAGACGVLLGDEETVGLTPVVAKASAGAVDRIPVAREPHISKRLEILKGRLRIVALDAAGTTPWDQDDLSGGLVLLAGGEGAGLRPGLRNRADRVLSIPLSAGVESLNVSVAVGVLLFEALRQRRAVRRSS